MKKAHFVVAGLIAAVSAGRVARADCSSGWPCLSHNNTGGGFGLAGSGTYGVSASGSNTGLQATSGTGTAIQAVAWGSGYGIRATSGSGTGVLGEAVGNAPGGHFKTFSTGPGSCGIKVEAPLGSTAIFAQNSGGTVAWLEGNVFAESYGSTSDARLKKEVQDLSYGLEGVLKLRPVSFKWKMNEEDKRHLGLIAQEVEKVVPEVVARSRDPKGTEVMTVNYTELVPVLIQAVHEQEARIVALERERASLKTSSMLGGGAILGLLPVGLAMAWRRRKSSASSVSEIDNR
jgi:hypothetical protein